MSMQKAINKIRLVATCVTLILALAAAPLSFAWFSQAPLLPGHAEIVPGYFAGGDGTAEHPFIIKKPIHLYNLAWLQALGRFNDTHDKNGMLVQYHFVLADNLDMTGTVLPLIGTAKDPFIGTFRSDGDACYTIENLTVSNIIDNNEITKRPAKVTNISGVEIVGMFGVVGQYNGAPADATYGSIVPMVENFYLDNPVIRTQTPNSLAGLIAGYVNGKLHHVGVKGGTLTSGSINTTGLEGNGSVISKYALIGDRDASVAWGGVPVVGDESGGPIKIDASLSETATAIKEISTEKPYVQVPGSRKDGAFFVDDADDLEIKIESLNPFKPGNTYLYNRVLDDSDKGLVDTSKNDFISTSTGKDTFTQAGIDAINNGIGEGETKFVFNKDFYDLFYDDGIASRNLSVNTGTSAPNINNTTTIQVGGKPLVVPAYGIWFSPASSGNCIISFTVSNMGGNSKTRYKSIYKIIRDENNNLVRLDEVKLEFENKNPFGNGHLAVFQYKVEEGSEYVIGASTGAEDDSIKFYFLALAGAGLKGEEITDSSHELFDVNFINAIPANNASMEIAANGMPITTFVTSLVNTGSNASVTFTKAAMDQHADVASKSDDLEVSKRMHTAIVLPTTGGT